MTQDVLIEVFHDGAFREDRNLFEDLVKILQSSYENPRDAMNYSMYRCATLYLARGGDGVVLSFYFVNWEAIQLEDGSKMNAVYTGLCATESDSKNTGVASMLYFKFFEDYIKWREEQNGPTMMWGITASPIGWILAQRMQGTIGELEPNPDMTYSPFGEKIARAVFGRMKWERTTPANHPFAVAQAAPGKFSESEIRGIEKICKEQGITVFNDLDIDSQKGGRLLFLCHR